MQFYELQNFLKIFIFPNLSCKMKRTLKHWR